jgi:hypothetical protein
MPLAWNARLTKECTNCKQKCFRFYTYFEKDSLCCNCAMHFLDRYQEKYRATRFRESVDEFWEPSNSQTSFQKFIQKRKKFVPLK